MVPFIVTFLGTEFLLTSAVGGPHVSSLLASGPISAVVTADFYSICKKINRPCGLEPLIVSFKLKRS